jgi:hypothetical protein
MKKFISVFLVLAVGIVSANESLTFLENVEKVNIFNLRLHCKQIESVIWKSNNSFQSIFNQCTIKLPLVLINGARGIHDDNLE